MKIIKITYYVTTIIISVMMLFIAYETLTMPEVKESMEHLGFPDYFRVQIGIAKLIGVAFLWIPSRLTKDIAYIGFAIMFGSASIAYFAVGDPFSKVIAGIVFLAILIASYISQLKLQKK